MLWYAIVVPCCTKVFCEEWKRMEKVHVSDVPRPHSASPAGLSHHHPSFARSACAHSHLLLVSTWVRSVLTDVCVIVRGIHFLCILYLHVYAYITVIWCKIAFYCIQVHDLAVLHPSKDWFLSQRCFWANSDNLTDPCDPCTSICPMRPTADSPPL